MQNALFQIFNETNKFVAVTMGSKGVYWVENNSLFHCNVPKVKTVETNCAGDVFHGAFCYGLSEGFNELKVLKFAVVAAALKCQQKGARLNMITANDIEKYLETFYK